MFILFKIKLPKDIIIHISKFILHIHKHRSEKVIKYNLLLKSLPKLLSTGNNKPYIIITNNKLNNKKLVKFIYKYNNRKIIVYNYINKNKISNDVIDIYNNYLK